MKKTNSNPDISALLKSIEEIRSVCSNQQEEINELKRENKELKIENKTLKSELASNKHKKDSSNSSMPPSSGIGKTQRTRSIRKSMLYAPAPKYWRLLPSKIKNPPKHYA